jgi:hypothetical protein
MDQMFSSPWLTTKQAAVLLLCSAETIRRHARRYRATNGVEGLKAMQRGGWPLLIHYDDLMRWRRGDAPTRGERRWRQTPTRVDDASGG